MKITSFNKNNLQSVRLEINKKLEELKELGLTIELGNISFNENTFTSKLTCTISAQGDKYSIEYNKQCYMYGMTLESVGATFSYGCKSFTFLGFKPNARTKKAIYKDNNSEDLYVCSVDVIKLRLGY